MAEALDNGARVLLQGVRRVPNRANETRRGRYATSPKNPARSSRGHREAD
jgi:hypothetical protein